MAVDVDKRVRFFNGQFLREEDFNDEQAYHLDRQRRPGQHLFTPGVAEGLAVTTSVGASEAVVAPGTGIDGEGRQIVLPESRTVQLAPAAGQTALVVISYAEDSTDPVTPGTGSERRWHERPAVQVLAEIDAPPAETHLRLARITVTSGGAAGSLPDPSVRSLAGGRLGGLTFRREGEASALWPTLTSGAPGRLDLAGSLDLSGQLNSRDVAADGAALDAHLAHTNNPHGLTAQQLGALLASDYDDLSHREVGYVSFNYGNADGAPKDVDVGFRPKFVWVSANVYATMNSNYQGAATSGYAIVRDDGTIDQYSLPIYSYSRATSPDFNQHGWSSPNSYVSYAYFRDYTKEPDGRCESGLTIASADDDGLTVNLLNHQYAGYSTVPFYLYAYLACFG